MELQQLRYIIALSQEGNFLRAARRAHVTQPTLSQQVKKLEEEIGQTLFERSPQGVRLTSAGEKFIPYATATIDNLEKGLSQLQEDAGQISGTLKLGAIPTITPYLLPGVIAKLRKDAPKLILELYEETTSTLLESLKVGKIDLGILSLPISDPNLVSRALGREAFFLAVTKKHPLAKKKQVSTQVIKHEKLLILQEGHCFSDQALDYCKRRRDDTQVIFQGSSLTSVMRLASAGEGLTLVPKMAINPKENANLAFIPFTAPKPSREVGLIWRVTAPLTPTHRYIMDSIEKVFKATEKK